MRIRLLVILSLGVALLVPTFACSQEIRRTISFDYRALPAELALRRGTVLDVTGPRPSSVGRAARIYVLKSGDDERTTERTDDRWTLRWDTAQETGDRCFLTVWRRDDGGDVRLGRSTIRFVTTPMFEISSPAESARVIGWSSVRVTSPAAYRATRYLLTLDGQPLPVEFDEHGAGKWDVSGVPEGSHILAGTVYADSGVVFPLDAVHFTTAGSVGALPFEIGDRLNLSTVNGYVRLRARVSPSIRAKSIAYMVDGLTAATRLEPPLDTAYWDPSKATNGPHRLKIDVIDAEGAHHVSSEWPFRVTRTSRRKKLTEEPHIAVSSDVNSPDADARLSPERALIFSPETLPGRVAISTDTPLVIAGDRSSPDWLVILVDRRELARTRDDTFNFPLDTSKLTLGPHKVIARAEDQDGRTLSVLAQCDLTVREKAVAHLGVPTDPKLLIQPVALAVADERGQEILSATVYKDGGALTADAENPRLANWDPRTERPGAYTFWAIATVADGSVLRTPPVVVRIPSRVTVDPTLREAVVTETARPLPVKLTFAEGLTPRSVELVVDGEVIATRTKAPFDVMAIPVNRLGNGAHKLMASVACDGSNYRSRLTIFGTADDPNAVAKAHEDVQKRIAYEDLAERRRNNPVLLRRRRLFAGLAAEGLSGRRGTTGAAHILLVNVLTATDRKTGITTPVDVFGAMSSVYASLVPGSGRIMFDRGNIDEDLKRSLENAVAYSKNVVRDVGVNVDWPALDVSYSWATNKRTPAGGPSAGAAQAVALVSAACNMPVDSSVVMTGTCEPDGSVGAVGGIDLKGVAALRSATIRTLILPAGNIPEIVDLFLSHPQMFVNRRLIVAQSMSQVLRQSVIGYDPATYDGSEQLVLEGIRDYVDAYDEESLKEFAEAGKLTPENATIYAWMAEVRHALNEPLPATIGVK